MLLMSFICLLKYKTPMHFTMMSYLSPDTQHRKWSNSEMPQQTSAERENHGLHLNILPRDSLHRPACFYSFAFSFMSWLWDGDHNLHQFPVRVFTNSTFTEKRGELGMSSVLFYNWHRVLELVLLHVAQHNVS